MNIQSLLRSAHLFVRIGLVTVVAGLVVPARAVIPPAEKLLPADTLLVISIPDCVKAKAAFQKSPRGLFLNDPAMKPFCDKFTDKFQSDFTAPLERELGIKMDDYQALAQGQFTFAITQEKWNGQGSQTPALLLLLDCRDKSGQLKTNLSTLRKKWVESGKSVETEKIRGVEFMVLPMSSNDVPRTVREFFPQHQEVQELGKEPAPKRETPTELYIGQFETLLIVGDSASVVEKVVAHLTGGSVPALADEALFEADRLALFRDATVFSWINVKRFTDVMMSLPPDEPNPDAPSLMPQFDIRKTLSATGLSGIRTVAFGSRYTDGGSLFEMFVGAPEPAREGLIKILAAPAKDSSPPAFIPAGTVKFQRCRIDGQQAMTTVEKMLGDISPQLANLFNFFLSSAGGSEKDKDPNFDLKKSLFGNLGDDFIGWSKASPHSPGESMSAPASIFLIGSPNTEKLAAALKMLLAMASPMNGVKEREFLGRKIYTLGLPAAPQGRTNTPAGALSFSPSGGYIAFSTDAAMLEEYLRSSDSQLKPLRELPGLADAAQKVGGESTGIFSYENEAETGRLMFDQLRKTSANTNEVADFNPVTSSMPFAHPEKNFKSWLDFSLLPDFSRVSKYFYFSVFSSSATANGIYLRAFSPNPPALK